MVFREWGQNGVTGSRENPDFSYICHFWNNIANVDFEVTPWPHSDPISKSIRNPILIWLKSIKNYLKIISQHILYREWQSIHFPLKQSNTTHNSTPTLWNIIASTRNSIKRLIQDEKTLKHALPSTIFESIIFIIRNTTIPQQQKRAQSTNAKPKYTHESNK